jgi:hypothetical protein
MKKVYPKSDFKMLAEFFPAPARRKFPAPAKNKNRKKPTNPTTTEETQ